MSSLSNVTTLTNLTYMADVSVRTLQLFMFLTVICVLAISKTLLESSLMETIYEGDIFPLFLLTLVISLIVPQHSAAHCKRATLF
jgi:hypothetical protein